MKIIYKRKNIETQQEVKMSDSGFNCHFGSMSKIARYIENMITGAESVEVRYDNGDLFGIWLFAKTNS